MTLIFGGAYQGKLEYALANPQLADPCLAADMLSAADVTDFGAQDAMPELKSFNPDGVIINNIDRLILEIVKSESDPVGYIRELLRSGRLSGKIVICNDISCGVVPIDPVMRAWREAVGRCLALLSAEADNVIRMFCGIGTVMKMIRR